MEPELDEGVPYGRQLTIRAETDPFGPALTVIGRDGGDEQTLSWAALERLANQWARVLQNSGATPESFVALSVPNSVELVAAALATWKIGAVPIPMRWDLPDWEHQRLLDVISPAFVLSEDNVTELAAAAATQDDSALLDIVSPAVNGICSSGSTGLPKIILNTAPALWTPEKAQPFMAQWTPVDAPQVILVPAPMYHTNGFGTLNYLLGGDRLIVLEKFDAGQVLDAIERHRVTATAVVPTIIYLLLDDRRRADYDIDSLLTVIYAGAPMAPERLRQALDTFGPIFIQTYAGTEQGYLSCLRKHEHRAEPGESQQDWVARLASAGRPMFGVQVSIQDETDTVLPVGEVGEICSRQLGQMLGYLDPARDAETLRGGWVHTGDVGRLDENGYLYLVDRKRDMVVSGGFNVFPRQVEDALCSHGTVAQAAVIGIPHEKWGEAVLAVVVARPGELTGPDLETELIQHVKVALGSVAAPKQILFTDALPLNPAGKVDKKAIRKPYWQNQTRQVG